MLRLGLAREPRWIALPHGVSLLVKPTTTALVSAARARAWRQLTVLRKAAEEARDQGLPVQGPDLTDNDRANGYAFQLTCIALAEELVEDWKGIGDHAGSALPFDRAALSELMGMAELAESFHAQVTAAPAALAAEGNG